MEENKKEKKVKTPEKIFHILFYRNEAKRAVLRCFLVTSFNKKETTIFWCYQDICRSLGCQEKTSKLFENLCVNYYDQKLVCYSHGQMKKIIKKELITAETENNKPSKKYSKFLLKYMNKFFLDTDRDNNDDWLISRQNFQESIVEDKTATDKSPKRKIGQNETQKHAKKIKS